MRVRETLTPEERRAKVVEILARGVLRLAAYKARRRLRKRMGAHSVEPGRHQNSASN